MFSLTGLQQVENHVFLKACKKLNIEPETVFYSEINNSCREVYNKNFFKSNPSASIFESIQNINGIRPQINCGVCNTGDIHINGQDGSNTMVLIDGLPIVSGLSTVYGLTGIPQSLIEKIEIIKGVVTRAFNSVP
mgnify:CR=1 FL=1